MDLAYYTVAYGHGETASPGTPIDDMGVISQATFKHATGRARWESEDSETLHTSFVERLNLTIRPGSAYLRRRSRPATPVAPTSSTGTSTSCAALTMSSGRTGRCSSVERPGRQRCTPAW